MKKLYIIFSILLLGLTLQFHKVSAIDYGDFTYTIVSGVSNEQLLLIDIDDIPSYIEEITFRIPSSSYHLYEGTNHNATISFRDDTDTSIETVLNLEILFPELIDGEYVTLNLQLLGVEVGHELDNIQITIPQTFALGGTPSGYWSYLDNYNNENPTVSYDDGIQEYWVLEQTTFFTRIYKQIDVPINVEYVQFQFNGLDYHERGTYKSFITLLDDEESTLDTMVFEDFIESQGDLNASKDLVTIQFDFENGYSLNDIYYMGVYLYISSLTTHAELIEYQTLVEYDFNSTYIKLVQFWDDDELYATDLVKLNQLISYPTDPTPPSTALAFDGWVTHTGEDAPLIMTAIILPDENVVLNLYSHYTIATTSVDVTPDAPVENTTGILGAMASIFDSFGLSDTIAYYLIYFTLFIVIVVFMVVKRVPTILFGVVGLGIHVLFQVWGILPSAFMITGYVLYGALIFISLVGIGGKQNEPT